MALHHALKVAHIVCANLVAQPARAAVDEQRNLAVAQPEGLGRVIIENLGDVPHLQEVVARTKRAQLRAPALARLLADQPCLGPRQTAACLAVQQVFRRRQVLVQTPGRAAAKHFIHLVRVEGKGSAPAQAAGAVFI